MYACLYVPQTRAPALRTFVRVLLFVPVRDSACGARGSRQVSLRRQAGAGAAARARSGVRGAERRKGLLVVPGVSLPLTLSPGGLLLSVWKHLEHAAVPRGHCCWLSRGTVSPATGRAQQAPAEAQKLRPSSRKRSLAGRVAEPWKELAREAAEPPFKSRLHAILAACSGWTCSSKGVGRRGSQRSLSTPFCHSLKITGKAFLVHSPVFEKSRLNLSRLT